MKITFNKISGTHHELLLERANQPVERVVLETKDFMPHDLIHLAYEKEAGLMASFWGMLAASHNMNDFRNKDVLEQLFSNQNDLTEAHQTEMITGALTGILKGNLPADQVMAIFENMLGAREVPVPAHLTPDFIERFRTRFRALNGQWLAMKINEPMIILFP